MTGMNVMRFFSTLVLLYLTVPGVKAQGHVPRFTDVTRESGIDFLYNFGDESYENILESSGSGVTVFDYNNDGLMDIYLLNGTYLPGISDEGGKKFQGSANAFYQNNGDGTFKDVSRASRLDDPSWGMAASPVDLDQDGYQDLYLLNYGDNIYLHNNGDGTFSDQTERLGLKGPAELNGFVKWSIGAAFWDQNKDGRLDVMVGNFLAFDPGYVSAEAPNMMPHPAEYRGQASMLYEQQEDGAFKEVTQAYDLFYPDSKCMGLSVFDYDADGDLDILASIFNPGAFVWVESQDGLGSFSTANIIYDETERATDINAAFIDGDTWPDIVTASSFDDTVAWYKNLGGLSVTDQQLEPISIYPNPSDGIVEIQSMTPIKAVEVFSVLGQSIKKLADSNVIDLTSLQTGIYFLKIQDNSGHIRTKRILIN